ARIQELEAALAKALADLAEAQARIAAAEERAAQAEAKTAAAEAALAAEKAAAEELRRRIAELEEKLRKLEELQPLLKEWSLEDLHAEVTRLRAIAATIEARLEALRTEYQYAALIEEPDFAAIDAATKELAARPSGAAAGTAIAARATADAAVYPELLKAVHARKGSFKTVAKLEMISAVEHFIAGDLARWNAALGK
ncbi:MAG TPA: hypothetical protein VHF22_14300, partial [Planctomycetota bacterium]|nr:hypothetical protein [Planctomycetota bacterium]